MVSYADLQFRLLPWASIWQHSILQRWPESRSVFPGEWLNALRNLDEDEQRRVDDEGLPSSLPASLLEAMGPLQDLCELPRAEREASLDPLLAQGMSRKKQHEIQRLLPFLEDKVGQRGIRRAVDIGGGMGHLARICVQHLDLSVHSIDQDRGLQDSGREWARRTRRFPRERLTFVNAFFSGEADETVDPLFEDDALLSIGLHTCGPLALHQFRKSKKAAGIMNLGCCYDRLDLERDVNLSQLARERPLPWTQHALFLATRGRKGKNAAQFALMKRVNRYRFAAHLFLQKAFPEEPFVVLGDAPKELYAKSFSAYLSDRLARIGKACPPQEELEDFFEAAAEEVADIFSAHLIRGLFARPLEVALLLDRRHWLEEQGHAVTLLQFFDRSLSPRNIGLFAVPGSFELR